MGGEIKVVQKNGLGTLMRLYLILSTPDNADQNLQQDFSKYGLVVCKKIMTNASMSLKKAYVFI